MNFKRVFPLAFIVLLWLPMFFVFNRGVILHDEGHVLHAASRLLQGEIIYRDFKYLYSPFSVYITTLIFRLLGESIFAGRFLLLITAVLTSYLIFKLLSLVASVKPSLIVLAISIYIVWLPMHINFPYPVHYAILWSMVMLIFIFKPVKTGKNYYWTFAGISGVFVFLSKQNFGIAALITLIISVLLIPVTVKRKLNYLLFIFIGICLFSFLYCLYLISTNSLYQFIDNVLIYPVFHFVGKNIMATPFIYPGVWYRQVFKIVIYLLPLLISLYGLLLVRKKSFYKLNYNSVILFIFIAVFYLAGIRPTTDYIHLVPLLSVSGIGLALVIALEDNSLKRTFLWFVGILLYILGLLTSIWFGYYRWETPLIKQNLNLSSLNTNIFVDQKYFQVINYLTEIVKNNTANRYIFTYFDRPLLYLILDKGNPTGFVDITPGLLIKEEQQMIVEDLKSKNIDLIITHYPFSNNLDPVEKFIIDNFVMIGNVYEYNVWKIRK